MPDNQPLLFPYNSKNTQFHHIIMYSLFVTYYFILQKDLPLITHLIQQYTMNKNLLIILSIAFLLTYSFMIEDKTIQLNLQWFSVTMIVGFFKPLKKYIDTICKKFFNYDEVQELNMSNK